MSQGFTTCARCQCFTRQERTDTLCRECVKATAALTAAGVQPDAVAVVAVTAEEGDAATLVLCERCKRYVPFTPTYCQTGRCAGCETTHQTGKLTRDELAELHRETVPPLGFYKDQAAAVLAEIKRIVEQIAEHIQRRPEAADVPVVSVPVDLGNGVAVNPAHVVDAKLSEYSDYCTRHPDKRTLWLTLRDKKQITDYVFPSEAEARAAYAKLTAPLPRPAACKYWMAYEIDGQRVERGAETLEELHEMIQSQ